MNSSLMLIDQFSVYGNKNDLFFWLMRPTIKISAMAFKQSYLASTKTARGRLGPISTYVNYLKKIKNLISYIKQHREKYIYPL